MVALLACLGSNGAMLNTDKAWQKWGRDDPYFGVLADQRFARERIESSRAAFFATGDDYVDGLLKSFEHHFGALPRGRALDHGCGVGRLTLPLAHAFASVVALDVSPEMLAEAAANAAGVGVANICFAAADDTLGAADGGFDFVNSHLVLQHVPVSRGMKIIDALVDRVAPGGGFHVSVSHRTDRGARRLLYWASANIPGVKLWQNVCARRDWNAPAMQMNDYPLGQIVALLGARGISSLVVTTHVEPRFVTCSLLGRTPA
jgi:2-polyprenyl-3-methyl-5-hydroxy-6-metoxy-1,4-benzoquinol methylase